MARAASPRPRGRSLIGMILPALVGVVMVVYFGQQLLGFEPNSNDLTPTERLATGDFIAEVLEALPVVVFYLILTCITLFVVLHLGLRPLRRMSEQAAMIGPSNLEARLSLAEAPAEIAPMVESFNAALDRLEAGWRAQREFSANAAHELRTPLAALRAQVESLLEPEDRKSAVLEFDRLSRLITQLLMLAEAEHGQARATETFDLVDVARRTTSDLAPAIVSSGRQLEFGTTVAVWPCLGHPLMVEVALRNLLENAIRHTPDGARITVAVGEAGRLTVCDDGPGVAPAFVDRLFDRFSKADPASGGAGLGLSIVARIMALHGGEVRLDPRVDGACFELDFSNSARRPEARPARSGWKSTTLKASRKADPAEVAG